MNLKKIWLPVIISVSVIFGMFIGRNNAKLNAISTAKMPVTRVYSKVDYALKTIGKRYVDSINVAELEEKLMTALMEQLDPHSTYISAEDFDEANESLQGNFDGIGVQFNIQKDTIYVVNVIAGGPAEKVGVRDGDRIVTVDDTIYAGVGITNDKVMKKLRGPRGTQVTVGIKRRGEQNLVPITITRGQIPLYSVDAAFMVDNEVGYIKLSKFSRTTYEEFQRALVKLKSQGMKRLLFDLRGNGGGYLGAAISVCDEFLPNGTMIVYTEGLNSPREDARASARQLCEGLAVVVLIDEFSASASEITAGALQDNDRATIVGRRSFGKGLVQEPIDFKDHSQIRLTIARYYTPSGRCIQKPYEMSEEEYAADLLNRFERGEFSERDSIHIDDSTEYYTSKGRVVYGGGGIMPDIFIPADTTGVTPFYNKVNRKGIEYQFAIEYTDNNRSKMSNLKTANDIDQYLANEHIFDQFIEFAKKQGIKPSASDLKVSRELLDTQIRALIARNLINDEGFYPIYLRTDKTFTDAITILKNIK